MGLLKILEKQNKDKLTSFDYRNGTVLDQYCRLHSVISLGFGQIESLSEKNRDCHKEGSNLRRKSASPTPDFHAKFAYGHMIYFY